MGRILGAILSTALAILALYGGPSEAQECSHGKITGRCRDIGLIRSVKQNGYNLSSDGLVLWVEQGYLPRERARALLRRIDKGIEDIEAFLGVEFDSEVYGQNRIEYFVHGRRTRSHTLTGSSPRKYLHPVVLLSQAKSGRTPYLAETVKIIAWDWGSRWLFNGLSIHLNDALSGYPAFPNFGDPLDDMAAAALGGRSAATGQALNLVGRNGVPKLDNRRLRRMFYVLSGSFVGHLVRAAGISKIMEVYPIKDTEAAILAVTGKSVEAWKEEWMGTLGR